MCGGSELGGGLLVGVGRIWYVCIGVCILVRLKCFFIWLLRVKCIVYCLSGSVVNDMCKVNVVFVKLIILVNVGLLIISLWIFFVFISVVIVFFSVWFVLFVFLWWFML